MEIGFICSIDKRRWESNPALGRWMWFDDLQPNIPEEYEEENYEIEGEDADVEVEEQNQVPKSMEEIKFAAIIDAINRNNGDVRATAKDLRIGHATIYRILQYNGYRTKRGGGLFQKKEEK